MLGRTLLILAMAALLVANNASAHEVDQATIARLARHWLAQRSTAATPPTIRDLFRIEDAPVGIMAYVVRLKPCGYLLFMGDTRLPPILAFSFTNDIDLTPGPQNAFRSLLQQDLERMRQNLEVAAGSAVGSEFVASNESRWQALLRESGPALPATDDDRPHSHGGK